MSFVIAYGFCCDLSLPEVLRALRARTPWDWVERDSEFWGDYTSARAGDEPVLVKVFVEGDRYLAELKFLDDAHASDWEPVAERVLAQFLPVLGARDVEPAESNN